MNKEYSLSCLTNIPPAQRSINSNLGKNLSLELECYFVEDTVNSIVREIKRYTYSVFVLYLSEQKFN